LRREPATVETITFGLWPAPSRIDGDAWPASLKHPELIDIIVGTFYEVFRNLGTVFWNPSLAKPSSLS
jgi:hypothetical protein